MRRFATALAFAAIAAALGSFPAPASAQHGPMMGHQRCHRGSHWIPAHRDRRGHWVRGHCSM
jgi:Spy/CpxP family protein refolding chaperone